MKNIMLEQARPTSLPVLDAKNNQKHVNSKIPNIKYYAKHHDILINGAALSYTLIGYCISIVCITSKAWQINIAGSLLLIHTLLWSAYFIHEFFHHSIFKSRRLNILFGEIFLFLSGSCYCKFDELAEHHIRHHTKRIDLSPFSPYSMPDILKSLPKNLVYLIVFLELLYLPAVNLGLRWLIALAPFLGKLRRAERLRNGLLLLCRGSFFTVLALYSPRGIFLYFISYIFFLNMTQFLECFQHTFPTYRITEKPPRYDLRHEEDNTYTIIISQQWRWLDLLFFLNHNYHGAHHRLMTCPWYLLPELDQEIYKPNSIQHVSAHKLIRNYLDPRARLKRLLNGVGEVQKNNNGSNFESYVGATGFSFMLLRTSFDFLNLPLPANSLKSIHNSIGKWN